MSDMSQVIQPKSDQINADDLISGPVTITITGVKVTPGTEQPVSMSLDGTGKVYRPCKSMSRVMVTAWGPDASKYSGRQLTIYRDPKVKWGGMEVGGIRISHMSHIEGELRVMVTQSKANRAPMTIRPLQAPPTAPQPPANAYALAESAAMRGTDAFRAWWASDEGRMCRGVASEHMDALKSIAAKADADAVGQDDGPPM